MMGLIDTMTLNSPTNTDILISNRPFNKAAVGTGSPTKGKGAEDAKRHLDFLFCKKLWDVYGL